MFDFDLVQKTNGQSDAWGCRQQGATGPSGGLGVRWFQCALCTWEGILHNFVPWHFIHQWAKPFIGSHRSDLARHGTRQLFAWALWRREANLWRALRHGPKLWYSLCGDVCKGKQTGRMQEQHAPLWIWKNHHIRHRCGQQHVAQLWAGDLRQGCGYWWAEEWCTNDYSPQDFFAPHSRGSVAWALATLFIAFNFLISIFPAAFKPVRVVKLLSTSLST